MCNICVFAGTTEGRELVEFLAGQPVQATVCVATEYGETLLPEAENITILAGRIPVEDIIRMLQRMRFDLVIDATHPYATSITESLSGNGDGVSAPAAAILRTDGGCGLRGECGGGRRISGEYAGQYPADHRQ